MESIDIKLFKLMCKSNMQLTRATCYILGALTNKIENDVDLLCMLYNKLEDRHKNGLLKFLEKYDETKN